VNHRVQEGTYRQPYQHLLLLFPSSLSSPHILLTSGLTPLATSSRTDQEPLLLLLKAAREEQR
jgi:hypothetical protein